MPRHARLLLAVLVAVLAVPAGAHAATTTGRVLSVRDGDTLRVRVGSVARTVNLLGIRAPGLDVCFGRPARDELRDLAPRGSRVRLVGDRRRPGRAKYVFRGSTLLNRTMVARGFARSSGSRRLRFATRLRRAQSSARNAGRGLWDECGPTGEPETGETVGTPPPEGPNTEANRQVFDAELRDTRIVISRSGGEGEFGFTEEVVLSFCQDGRMVFQRTLVSPAAGNEQNRSDGTWRVDQVTERAEAGIAGLVAVDVRDAATGQADQGTIPIAITGPDTARVRRNGEEFIGRRSSLGGTCP